MVQSENRNKRIAKNTVYLYIRMILVMFVSLYTVRVVLKNLGVDDYGIYNLIGGVVVLFSFINNSSSTATQRFLNISLGEGDLEKANRIFSCSLIIHFFVAIIILILSETIGLWCLNYYLVIPSERMVAANWVYQFSVFATVINIIKIPYNASIIAYEKMSFYAVLSIFECIGKLLIAFSLSICSWDKLIFYSILVAVLNLILFFVFKIYSNRKLEICHYKFHKEKTLYKEILSFSGWSLLSSIGSTCSTQVLTIILNKFFGVVANAAIGIANQVNNAVYQLISNFQIAFEPQIIKSYAAKENDYLCTLIFRTSKFSFFLLWFFILPLSLNADFVLKIWLSEVPAYTLTYLRIILIYSLIDSMVGPLWMVSYAIGDIRNYQIVAFAMSVITVPIAWILFKLGFPSYWVLILRVLNNLCFSIWRLAYLKKRMNFPVMNFLKNVLFPSLIVCFITFCISWLSFYFTKGICQFFVSCFVSVISNISIMYFIGCNKSEKEYILNIIKQFFHKNK